MKRNILILGAFVIAFVGVCGAWLYAQEELHPAVPATTTRPPVGVETSTVAQIVLTNTSTPATLSAASTTPTVGTPVAVPSIIVINTSTPVTVTVQITAPTLIPGSVNLLLLGEAGTQPTILGVMQNTGNGIYSLQTALNEGVPGQIQLQVSAAFQGLLRRVLSSVSAINVWNSLNDPSSNLSFAVPDVSTPLEEDNLGSTTATLFVIDVEADMADNTARSLFRIFAFQNPSQLGIEKWFEENIDDASGSLLSSGAFVQQQLSNGPALVEVGPIPPTYQGAPVAQAYVLAASGTRIYAITQSQDLQLTQLGYPSSSVGPILTSKLGSVQ